MGRVRSPRDIDLLILSDEPTKAWVIDSLQARGFDLDAMWMEQNPMAKNRVLRFNHPSYPGIPLDLMLSADAHEALTLSRRKPLQLLDVRM